MYIYLDYNFFENFPFKYIHCNIWLLFIHGWILNHEKYMLNMPGNTQSKTGRLHAGIFYEAECLENSGTQLLVVMADIYNIYLRLWLSDVILQKE